VSETDAKFIYETIWAKFAEDRKENRAMAYANLQRALAEHAADLVPAYMTAKEHMSMVSDVEQWTKSDKQSESGDPLESMSGWLRGDLELSRIPLETGRKN
jgi:hypothetical protein